MRSYSSSPTTLISGLCHWTGNPHVGETRLLRLCACACTWKDMVRIRSWNTKWRLVFHPIQIMRWCQQNPDRRKECYLSLALPLPLSLSCLSLSLHFLLSFCPLFCHCLSVCSTHALLSSPLLLYFSLPFNSSSYTLPYTLLCAQTHTHTLHTLPWSVLEWSC